MATEQRRNSGVMSVSKGDTHRKRALVLRPSSRATNGPASGSHGVNPTKHTTSGLWGSSSRRRFSLGGGSKVLEKSTNHTPRQEVRVLDENNRDVTPQPLLQLDPGAVHVKGHRFYLEEMCAGSTSEQTTATGSFSRPFSRSLLGSSRISSQSTIDSVNEEMEETFSRRDMPFGFVDVTRREPVKQRLIDDTMKANDIYISETETISLLTLPCTHLSVDADDAEAVKERNKQYAELCKNKLGNDKYMERSMQTTNGAVKHKQIQSDGIHMVDQAVIATSWDMYDTMCGPDELDAAKSSEPENLAYPDVATDTSGVERSMSMGSTTSLASAASSLRDLETVGSTAHSESELQHIMNSEQFLNSLLVMERSITGNIFQPELAEYRQLPALDDPDWEAKFGAVKKGKEEGELREPPALQQLWTFSCELNQGHCVTSMAWNRKNLDILAVGYSASDPSCLKQGLVCCWSLKNPTWPECVIRCDSAVSSLDFSAFNPSQLAVGMIDGSIAIYSLQSQNKNWLVLSSSECPKKHTGPVWQVKWTQQELNSSGEEKMEALFSVSADGRISRWFVFNSGLDCIDVMKLKRIYNRRSKAGLNAEKTESVLSALTPGLCFDFHPTDSGLYLAGTSDGVIHKCSCSNSQQYLETYRKHFRPVNCVAWSPLCHDVFLSCSSDWTIQLWKRDHLRPLLGFTSTQRAVCDIKWSSKSATVFGAVNEGQLEIWDMSTSPLDYPVAVQPAAPGVTLKTLLFALNTDCVLVGDSIGQVTVYKLKNICDGEGNQVEDLESLIQSATSK